MFSISMVSATAAAMATTIFNLNGNANAATAAAPATTAETRRNVLDAKELATPANAKIPAKPKPQVAGILCANAMPVKLAVC